MNIPKIAILLAGFEGEKYFSEQILSLLGQKQVKVDIYVRVDGDSESFKNQVQDIAINNKQVNFIEGDIESSSGMNFYKLVLSFRDNKYDYYAFCDQDDIWLENKLNRAIGCMLNSNALGYSSSCTAFFSSGRKVVNRVGSQRQFDHFFQAAGPGCTYVLSNKGFFFLQRFLKENQELLLISAHDWLIYFIFRLMKKKWFLDEDSHLLYRQHSLNVAGVNKGFISKLNRIKPLYNGWYNQDLIRLHLFARSKGMKPKFFNPLSLRRSKIYSIIIWMYYHLFAKKQIINREKETY
ncbi:glycosyltransferase family 2 protein [Gammaproteobacteria bacterium]|nr:glycosyltransferase family 2 protein [Gammaproteobacteria bacterium]